MSVASIHGQWTITAKSDETRNNGTIVLEGFSDYQLERIKLENVRFFRRSTLPQNEPFTQVEQVFHKVPFSENLCLHIEKESLQRSVKAYLTKRPHKWNALANSFNQIGLVPETIQAVSLNAMRQALSKFTREDPSTYPLLALEIENRFRELQFTLAWCKRKVLPIPSEQYKNIVFEIDSDTRQIQITTETIKLTSSLLPILTTTKHAEWQSTLRAQRQEPSPLLKVLRKEDTRMAPPLLSPTFPSIHQTRSGESNTLQREVRPQTTHTESSFSSPTTPSIPTVSVDCDDSGDNLFLYIGKQHIRLYTNIEPEQLSRDDPLFSGFLLALLEGKQVFVSCHDLATTIAAASAHNAHAKKTIEEAVERTLLIKKQVLHIPPFSINNPALRKALLQAGLFQKEADSAMAYVHCFYDTLVDTLSWTHPSFPVIRVRKNMNLPCSLTLRILESTTVVRNKSFSDNFQRENLCYGLPVLVPKSSFHSRASNARGSTIENGGHIANIDPFSIDRTAGISRSGSERNFWELALAIEFSAKILGEGVASEARMIVRYVQGKPEIIARRRAKTKKNLYTHLTDEEVSWRTDALVYGAGFSSFLRQLGVLFILRDEVVSMPGHGGIKLKAYSELGITSLRDSFNFLTPRTPISDTEILQLCARLLCILQALAGMHANNVYHFDVKPENILIVADGSPRIIDFGLSQHILPHQRLASNTSRVTPQYCEPQKYTDDPITNPAAIDIFALGAMLVHFFYSHLALEKQFLLSQTETETRSGQRKTREDYYNETCSEIIHIQESLRTIQGTAPWLEILLHTVADMVDIDQENRPPLQNVFELLIRTLPQESIALYKQYLAKAKAAAID